MDFLEEWAYVEADFQREYSINLVEDLSSISWRRFLILLGGLSGESLYILKAKQLAEENGKNSEKVIEDPEEAERAISKVWG